MPRQSRFVAARYCSEQLKAAVQCLSRKASRNSRNSLALLCYVRAYEATALSFFFKATQYGDEDHTPSIALYIRSHLSYYSAQFGLKIILIKKICTVLTPVFILQAERNARVADGSA
jgi:hypothetical protein